MTRVDNIPTRLTTEQALESLASCRTIQLVILEQVEAKIPDRPSVARLETDLEYVERYENKVFHYRWALRNPVIKEAITRALTNHLDPK